MHTLSVVPLLVLVLVPRGRTALKATAAADLAVVRQSQSSAQLQHQDEQSKHTRDQNEKKIH